MLGEISKHMMEDGLILEQRYLTKTKRLELDRERCFGCGICSAVCPKESITLSDPSVEEGRLVKRPEVEIDPESCILCGICVVFCPSNALKATTDGEEYVSVIEYDVMPTLTKTIKIESEKCDIACMLKCQESCPVEAINVETRIVEGAIQITGVNVDEQLCFYCKQCEAACPFNLIKVERYFKGRVELETDKCPEGCMACVDICHSNALRLDDEGKLELNQQFCILCSACEKVCPEDAIQVYRTSIDHSHIKSGTWFTVLEKLTSAHVLARELGEEAENHARFLFIETLKTLKKM